MCKRKKRKEEEEEDEEGKRGILKQKRKRESRLGEVDYGKAKIKKRRKK